jgi:hypothetical protein
MRREPIPMADPDAQQWESEYAAWCAEQDDADEINRMLDEANHDDE